MNNDNKKHVPIISVLTYHILCLVILLITQTEFLLAIRYNNVFITVSIINGIVLVAGIVTLILSITALWNKPIIFTKTGIIDNRFMKTKVYNWDEMVNIVVVTKYMGRYYRVVIKTIDGGCLKYEPNSSINNDFIKYCTSNIIQDKYKKELVLMK